jgi:hypothetical protein
MPWYPWHLPNYDLATMLGPGHMRTLHSRASARCLVLPSYSTLHPTSVNILWFYGTEKSGGSFQLALPGRATVGGSIVAALRAKEYMEVW